MIEPLLVTVVIVALALAALYLPASLELRKPRDNGPRIIEPSIQTSQEPEMQTLEKTA
jgi:hypothetical protein